MSLGSLCVCMCVHACLSLSRIRLFVTPRTAARQVSLSIGFSRQEWIAILFSRGSSRPRD